MSEIITSRNIGILTSEEQQKLQRARVAVIGLGAGSVIAELLVRTGFKNITIVDGDNVSETNLNRQLYSSKDVGKNKAIQTKERLLSLVSDINLTVVSEYLKVGDTHSLGNLDLIIDTIDLSSIEVIMSVHSYAKKEGIPVIFPINLGWKSMVTVFDKKSVGIENLIGGSESISDRVAKLDFSFWASFLERYVPEYGKQRYKDFLGKASSMNDWCPAPQLGATVFSTAALTLSVAVRVITDQDYVIAPDFEVIDLFSPVIE